MLRSIGLMSGTSMDGIDAALLETDGAETIKEVGHTSISYDDQFKILLKAAEYTIRTCAGDVEAAASNYSQALKDYLVNEAKMMEINVSGKIAELSAYLHGSEYGHQPITLDEVIQHSTYLHGKVVTQLLKETGQDAYQIDVVGYHGQTMFHRPSIKTSIIVGNGQELANQVGITVVNDFRRCDVAAGGQGAPFAPLFHYALARRDNKIPVAVVNCGGIANITFIPSEEEADLLAFDTGPGNGLIDKLVRQRTNNKENMDADGRYGAQGKVDEKILESLYATSIIKEGKNYFAMQPPKSLDIGDMALISMLDSLSLEDACATLEAFTADTIVNSLQFSTGELPRCLILAGGGWNNKTILGELKHRLHKKIGSEVEILTADEAKWNSKALEAQIFAYLAVRSLQGKALSLPRTTGVPQQLSGGHAYTPSNGPTEKVTQLLDRNPLVLAGYRQQKLVSGFGL